MIDKIRLITQEQASLEHNFWEDSPTRTAQNMVHRIMDADPKLAKAHRAFIGERNDGLWLWFFDAPGALDTFTTAWQAHLDA